MTDEVRASAPAALASGVVLAIVFFIVAAGWASFAIIQPGNVGVVFNRWSGALKTVGQGVAWRIPWITQVQSYPIALRTYTMVQRSEEGAARGDDSIDLPTKEGQHIRQDISVTYNTSQEKAGDVFRSFRGAEIADIEATFIRRTIITVAQNAAGQMSLTDLISNQRGQLQEHIQEDLQVQMNKMGFVVDKVNLGASHLPDAIEKQMQQKMGAQQNAQQADYELQRQQTLAKAKVAEAEGDAQATLVKAKAQAEANRLLQEALTPLLIQNKAIERWNGTLPQFTGGGAIPFLNLKDLSGDARGAAGAPALSRGPYAGLVSTAGTAADDPPGRDPLPRGGAARTRGSRSTTRPAPGTISRCAFEGQTLVEQTSWSTRRSGASCRGSTRCRFLPRRRRSTTMADIFEEIECEARAYDAALTRWYFAQLNAPSSSTRHGASLVGVPASTVEQKCWCRASGGRRPSSL
jgi:prohibitin 1